MKTISLSLQRGQLLISLTSSNILISQIIPKSEFSYADLRGINFIKNTQFDLVESEIIDMQDIDLSNSDLTQTRFNLVYFGSALFDRATIQGTEFFGCFLFGASMQNTVVTKTSFKSCNLDGLDLQSSVVDSVEFIDCNLSLPFLQAAKFGQVTMKNSWLFAPERFSGIDSIKGKINIENCYTTLKDWPERLVDSTSNKWQLDSVLVKQKTLTADSLIYSYMLEVGVNSQKLDTIYTVSCVIKAN